MDEDDSRDIGFLDHLGRLRNRENFLNSSSHIRTKGAAIALLMKPLQAFMPETLDLEIL